MSTYKNHSCRKRVKKRREKWQDHALVFALFIFLASLSYVVS